jgi:cell division protein FtsZ
MAANNAIQNPLLDEVSLRGAKAVLVNVTGGMDMTLLEVDEAANAISEQVDPEGNIIFGAAFDPSLDGRIRVSVVATGMDGASMSVIEPRSSRTTAQPPPLRFADPAVAEPVPNMAQPVSAGPGSAQPVLAPTPAVEMPAETAIFNDLSSASPNFLAPEQGDLLTSSSEPAAQIEALVEPSPAIRPYEAPVKKIVDPSVAGDDDADAIFPNPIAASPPQSRSSGFRLWGQKRPTRMDPPPVVASPRAGGALPVESPSEAPAPEGDNLEIPTFLRRLAN